MTTDKSMDLKEGMKSTPNGKYMGNIKDYLKTFLKKSPDYLKQ